MKNIIIKAYGSFEPITNECFDKVQNLCSSWYLNDETFQKEDNSLNIYYEGEYFPFDELEEILAPYIHEETTGVLNIIDYEAWTLQRYFFENQYQKQENIKQGKIYSRKSSLDHALEASQNKNNSIIIT